MSFISTSFTINGIALPQLLSQQEKLKRAQTRNQRMTRILREQEKILQKLKNESNDGEHRRRHHRYVSLRPKYVLPLIYLICFHTHNTGVVFHF